MGCDGLCVCDGLCWAGLRGDSCLECVGAVRIVFPRCCCSFPSPVLTVRGGRRRDGWCPDKMVICSYKETDRALPVVCVWMFLWWGGRGKRSRCEVLFRLFIVTVALVEFGCCERPVMRSWDYGDDGSSTRLSKQVVGGNLWQGEEEDGVITGCPDCLMRKLSWQTLPCEEEDGVITRCPDCLMRKLSWQTLRFLH